MGWLAKPLIYLQVVTVVASNLHRWSNSNPVRSAIDTKKPALRGLFCIYREAGGLDEAPGFDPQRPAGSEGNEHGAPRRAQPEG